MGTPDSVGEYIEVVSVCVCNEVRIVGSFVVTGGLSKAAMRERRAPSLAPARTVLPLELDRERLVVETDDFLDRVARSEKGLCWPALKKGLRPWTLESDESLPLLLGRGAELSWNGFCVTSE
jgi:hypothetical protein